MYVTSFFGGGGRGGALEYKLQNSSSKKDWDSSLHQSFLWEK